MKRPVIGRRSRYVRVSNFKNHCSDLRIFYLFPFFRGIQLFCGELGSTHPRTRVHYYSLTYYFREVGPTHPRTHVHYSSLFYAFFSERGVLLTRRTLVHFLLSLTFLSTHNFFSFLSLGFSLFFFFLAVPFFMIWETEIKNLRA